MQARIQQLARAVPWLLGAFLLLLGLPALRHYNVTWDEALGDLFFGQRYLSFFTTGDSRYLDFAADPYPDGHAPDLSASPFRTRPWEYYPAANMMAAASSSLLSGWLGLLDPFDGFHALNLLLAAGFLPLFYGFVRRSAGASAGAGGGAGEADSGGGGRLTPGADRLLAESAALVACGLLLLSPRVVCHLLANIKDFPEMVLFAAAAILFLRAYEAGSAAGLLGAGAVWGLALATKANALFLPPILGLFLLVDIRRRLPSAWEGRLRWLVYGLLGAGLLGATLMVALWPYLWADPSGRFARHLSYVSGQIFQVRAVSIAPPLEAVLLTTPPVFLLLVAVGGVVAVRRAFAGERAPLLLLIWIAVVFGRLYLPGAVNFDGVRHFLELFPALAAVAGLGAAELGRWLAARLRRPALQRWAVALLPIVWLLPVAASTVRTHPHQIAYWNQLAGGLAGARAAGKPQSGDYWGMSYRQGLAWLNQHAEPGSVLAVPVIQHAVVLVAPLRLREDIGIANVSVPFRPEIDPRRIAMLRSVAAERPVYVMFVLRDDWMNELMRECLETLTPVAEWSLEGVPLLRIYRYPPASSA